VRDVLLPEVY